MMLQTGQACSQAGGCLVRAALAVSAFHFGCTRHLQPAVPAAYELCAHEQVLIHVADFLETEQHALPSSSLVCMTWDVMLWLAFLD